MQWLADLFALLGTHGAYANASRSLADEREVAVQLDRFLERFDQPAGQARIVLEPTLGGRSKVA